MSGPVEVPPPPRTIYSFRASTSRALLHAACDIEGGLTELEALAVLREAVQYLEASLRARGIDPDLRESELSYPLVREVT